MPRIGAQTMRRKALIDAAILTIGEQGSLDVSVREIANRAGMSTALAFHYFGDKDEIVSQTMRHLMRVFSNEVRFRLLLAVTPRDRVDAIIRASFATSQFERTTIAAWLVFYLRAYSSHKAARLLQVYSSRLRSNLVHALSPLAARRDSREIAEGLAAMIDGLYVRHALRPAGPDAAEAIAQCQSFIEHRLLRNPARK